MNNIDILEEKEKKAIRMCDVLFISLDEIYKDGAQEYRMYYKTIKNLIETLIAENKELKDSNVELATTIDCLQTDLKEINEEYNAEQKHEMENTISKSKVEEEIQELKNMKVDGEIFKTAVNYAIKILQSLLGKK